MKPRLISVEQTPVQPWRNGGGSTRELLAWPSAADWQLRLSVADIDADGPFSIFDGVQRWFVVLQGAGVALMIDGQPHLQRMADAPWHFDGAARADCRLLDGPTRDLNLMLRGRRGGLLPAQGGCAWQPPGSVCGLFSRLPGHCQASAAPGDAPSEHELPALALLWFATAPASLCWQPLTASAILANAPPQAWWLWADTRISTPTPTPTP